MFSIKFQGAVRRFQQLVDLVLTGGRFPEAPQLALAGTGSPSAFPERAAANPASGQSFLESLKDGFVWGVPKKRKSLEKRLRKQWGHTYMEPMKLRQDLIVCLHCGNYHAAHSLCGHCYNIVKEETKLIQKAMDITARVEEQQEVVVLYEGESADPSTTEGKKIVEVPKPRPLWFNQVLLTKCVPRKTEE